MWHTLAWTKSLTASTLEELTKVQDGIFADDGTRFMPPSDVDLIAAYALGTDLQRVKITTARTRQLGNVYLRPIQPTLIGANDANVVLMDRTPFRLRANEAITVEAFQDNAGAQRGTLIACLSGGLTAVPPGEVAMIRANSTTAAVANAWSLLSYTLESALPAGTYAVLCCEHISANAQAHRLTFDQQFFRPGGPSLTDVNQRLPYPWLQYRFGMMGRFTNTNLPRVEVLCNGADAAHELYFHVVPFAGIGLSS